ncbi:MAG: gliding motility-associated C-terminal domain-containing protein [Crocinitomicaceae bacterium]|nr:gliding motility-associated C-terminal domain-containing protein [Crocinitomicaceae bacterium]
MKTVILFLLSVGLTGTILSQANTCGTANPFCSSQSYNFPNATSGSAPVGPNYGCLGSQPRPIWYYMEIGTSGTIDMLLQQTTGPNGTGSQIDVDFAMWGPYSSLSAGCTAIMSGSAPPIQCSFSSSYSEDLGLGVSGGTGTGLTTPPAAVAGQVYIVLLTNYDGAAGYISFNQTGGTGSADCSIVEPCLIDNFTATVSACNSATNTYSVNGNITVSNPPSAGQLIVQACDGTQTVVASAPFGSATYSYNIAGLNANGAACDVEVFFTGESCSQILNYTAPTCPPVCSFSNINANISACQQGSVFDLTGTLTFVSPPSTGQLIVQDCNGNSATYNAPFTSPLNFAINGIDADGQPCNATAHFTADPGCTISVSYTNTPSCECTVDIGTFSTTTAGQSNSTYVLCYGDEILIEPNGDYTPPGEALNPPLAEGYEPGIAWIMYSCPPTVAVTPSATNGIGDDPCFLGIVSPTDLYDINDLYWINGYPGTFTNNTVYFVPITMYNLTEYYYSYVNGGLPCYEMGAPYAVQYLPEITTTVTPNCQAGTVSVAVQGGSPAINGTNFTASNLQPGTASLASNTVANNGTFIISGLQNGDNYSLDIADEFGCPVTITGTFQGGNASGFTYPQNAYCKGAANPSPTLTGVAGGTYTGSAGLVINATTGVINIASTPPGNYVVTYTSPGAPCNSSSTFNITINPLPVVTAPNVAVCNGQAANLTASGANNYTWSPATGLNTTTGTNVVATLATNQTYTITGTNTTTGCVNTGTVTVTVNPNPTPVINGQSDYCTGTSATIQTSQTYASYSWSTGQTTPSIQVTTANNPIQVTVTNGFGCSGTSAVYTVTENNVITVNSQVEICQGQSTVIHGISRTTAGVYSVTLPSSNGCDSTSNVTLIVNPLPVIDAGPNQTVCEGETVILNATGAPAITWSPTQTNGVGFVQPVGSQIYTATGTDANNCVSTDQVEIIVRPNPVVATVSPQTRCNGTATAAVNFTSSVSGTTYTWTNDTPSIGLPSNGNGNINSFTATNTTSNPVIATITVTPTAAGCVGAPVSFTITVQPSPTATISGTTAVCIGGPSPQVTFTGGTGTAPYTITYTINGGAPQTVTTTGNTATVNAPTTTSGLFVYTLTNVTESGNTCSAAANGSVTITVNALPVINAGADVAVCQNGQITLTGTGAGVNGNYTWTPVITNGVPFVPASSGTYTVTGTDANGCSNTDNVNVTVNVAQNVDAGPNQEICIGEQVTLSGSPAGTGATFLWTGGITNGVAFTPNQSGTYTVTSTDVNGCNATDQVDVIVHNLPVIEAGSNISGCEGNQYTLTGSGAGVGGTYVWNHGVQNGVPFAPVASVSSYVVVGTDQYGCSNTDSILAKIEAIPVVSFYADIDQNCAPASVTFYNTTTDPAVNCLWTFDDGSTVSGCGPVTHIFQHAGVYGASLQVETPVNRCPGYLYQSAIVTIDANPVAHFTPNPAIGTQVNNQISFTNQSYGASSYYWEFGDGVGTSTAVNPVYTYGEESDLYTVMLIAYSNAGCVDTAYSLVTIREELIFYVPNTFTPDLDQYNEVFKPIFTYGYNPFDYTLMIFNRWGEMIFESHDASVGWDGTYGIDGKICQDGTYTWKIEVKTTSTDERKMFTGHVNIIR